jgi:hypothetical protein
MYQFGDVRLNWFHIQGAILNHSRILKNYAPFNTNIGSKKWGYWPRARTPPRDGSDPNGSQLRLDRADAKIDTCKAGCAAQATFGDVAR